jgi:type I restriction enzyme S subunit
MSTKAKPTATKEEVTPALVPKLRFPEFRKEPAWLAQKLAALCDLNKGEQLAKSAKDAGGRYPHYNGGISPSSYTGRANREANTIIISEGGNSCGYVQFVTEPFWSGGHNYSLAVKPKLETLYLFYALQSKQREIMALRIGSGLPNIQKSTLGQFEVCLPQQTAEQQTIAECLSSVDELMTTQARKVDALKTHKKGLMQQLFPREGETQPRLRFPEFQNAGEWVVRTVSQFAKVTTGAKDTQNKVEGGKYPFFVRSQTVERIDSYSHDGEAVLTSGDGVGVGKNFHHIQGKFDFHQRVYCIYDFGQEVNGRFFYLYFSENFGERVMRMSAKNSVDSVRMAMITDMPVMLPSLAEQQRIAECLISLDALITAESQKLQVLKTHKKGLMQQLFPSPEEN